MIGLPSLRTLDRTQETKIWLAVEPADMCCGFDRLAERVRAVIGQDPLSDALFIFRSRRGDRLKFLTWDRDGFILWYKRLEAGVFKLPRVKDGTRSVELRASELAMILDGIDMAKLKRVPRYERRTRPREDNQETTVRAIALRYEEHGLDAALYEKPRPGKQRALNTKQSQRIVALVCSPPPEGRARWSVRLIAEEAARRKLAPPVGRETIRILLQSHDLKPWREKMRCVAELNEEYIARMEEVLAVYEKPLQENEPVVCVDEKPVVPHGDVRAARPMRPGRILRRDCEYQRRGTANAFCGVEPKAGRHFTKITPNRSAAQFADYLLEIVAAYPEVNTIHLGMDNLNSHRRKAFVDRYGEKIGGQLWKRFTVHYTPKHGSWLNQAEIEISLFSRQCLGHRCIPSLADLRRQVRAWNRKMNQDRVKINWQFTRKKAQQKFRYKRTKFMRSRT